MSLSQQQYAEAWKLRARGKSWTKIGLELGVNPIDARNAIYPERANGRIRERHKRIRYIKPAIRMQIKKSGVRLPLFPQPSFLTGSPRPPMEVLAERERVAALPLTFGQFYFGDPLPGRSALDKRGA